jgi:hypothetical protein
LEFIIVPQGSAGDIMTDLNGHAAHVSDAHVGGKRAMFYRSSL